MKFKKLTALLLAIALIVAPISTVEAAINEKNYTTVAEAANIARAKMLNHEEKITAYIKSTNSDPVEVFDQYEKEVIKETSRSDEGDYLRWDINRTYPSYIRNTKKSGKTTYYYYKFNIEYWYFTTLEQKQQVDEKVKEIIAGFNFTPATTDYQKVKTIYDYVCNNVRYADNTKNDIVYTAWSALFNGEAVCQGYSQLLYKMFKEVGISNRVIPGYGKDANIMHGWNIVKVGNYYYNIDATWDAECVEAGKEYENFLKGDNFKDHTRLKEYNTTEFYSQYPMAANNYGTGTPTASFASKKSSFSVIKPKFKKVSAKKVKLVKVAGAKKYQIKYSTSKKFKKGTKTKTTSKTTYKFKKLKKKTYYVKFRAYTKIDRKKVYTQWSKTKKLKNK